MADNWLFLLFSPVAIFECSPVNVTLVSTNKTTFNIHGEIYKNHRDVKLHTFHCTFKLKKFPSHKKVPFVERRLKDQRPSINSR